MTIRIPNQDNLEDALTIMAQYKEQYKRAKAHREAFHGKHRPKEISQTMAIITLIVLVILPAGMHSLLHHFSVTSAPPQALNLLYAQAMIMGLASGVLWGLGFIAYRIIRTIQVDRRYTRAFPIHAQLLGLRVPKEKTQ